jgi:hypothetical protein
LHQDVATCWNTIESQFANRNISFQEPGLQLDENNIKLMLWYRVLWKYSKCIFYKYLARHINPL